MFSEASVSHSVHLEKGEGGVGYPRPLLRHMGPRILWDMIDKRAVRVLLECFLVDLFNI